MSLPVWADQLVQSHKQAGDYWDPRKFGNAPIRPQPAVNSSWILVGLLMVVQTFADCLKAEPGKKSYDCNRSNCFGARGRQIKRMKATPTALAKTVPRCSKVVLMFFLARCNFPKHIYGGLVKLNSAAHGEAFSSGERG